MVWLCLPFIRSGQNHLPRHSESGKKTMRTEEEVGRRHQGMDRPGVRQVPEGSGEQGKWRKLVAKSSVVPQQPSQLKDWWWWWSLMPTSLLRASFWDCPVLFPSYVSLFFNFLIYLSISHIIKPFCEIGVALPGYGHSSLKSSATHS